MRVALALVLAVAVVAAQQRPQQFYHGLPAVFLTREQNAFQRRPSSNASFRAHIHSQDSYSNRNTQNSQHNRFRNAAFGENNRFTESSFQNQNQEFRNQQQSTRSSFQNQNQIYRSPVLNTRSSFQNQNQQYRNQQQNIRFQQQSRFSPSRNFQIRNFQSKVNAFQQQNHISPSRNYQNRNFQTSVQLGNRNLHAHILPAQIKPKYFPNIKPTPIPEPFGVFEPLNLPSGATQLLGNIATTFTCADRPYGYYADVENTCSIFHICNPALFEDGTVHTYQYSFICGEGTVFDQDEITCVEPSYAIPCGESPNFYWRNRVFGLPSEKII